MDSMPPKSLTAAASQNQPPPPLHNMMMHLGLGSSQPSGSETGGTGIPVHVVHVHAGEDIAEKIIAFSQESHRTVGVFSAKGDVCSVMLKPNASFEGRFEIISLSGCFVFEEGGDIGVHSGLSVSLAGPDRRIFGGGVAGTLIAATPVQVFIVFVGSSVTTDSQPHHTRMLNFGGTEPVAEPHAPKSEATVKHVDKGRSY